MSRVQIQRIGTLLGLLLPTAITVGSSRIRKRVAIILGLQGRGNGNAWRFVAIILAILNLKNLPWVWHYRIFRGIVYHLWFQPTDFPPESLFKFIITQHHAPLWEIDYNLHKSNSTYFTDLDVARSHLVSALLRRGVMGVGKRPGEENTTWNISSAISNKKRHTPKPAINPLGTSGVETAGANGIITPRPGREMTEEEFMAIATKPGPLIIALGSVACFFHKEIAPYRKYEIWTRLLTWDRKWLYIVSYFVEAGAIRPEEFDLQPWRKSKNKRNQREGESIEDKRKRIRGKVFATSIATYVVKKGRLTIPPEVVLQRSSLLPEKPPGAPSPFYTPARTSPTTPAEGSSTNDSPTAGPMADSHAETVTVDSVASVLEESLFPSSPVDNNQAWTWENVEKERQRGLRFARVFDSLNGLREEFDGGEKGVLGTYSDMFGGI